MPFNQREVERVKFFFQHYLRHIKGRRHAGRPFVLSPFENQFIENVFGPCNEDGTRTVRTAYLTTGRKQGKSTFVAGLGAYLLLCDREPSAEIYSLASDRKQAAYLFKIADAMIHRAPALRRRTRSYASSIVVPDTLSSWQVLSRESNTKHGFNAHGVLADELHTQVNRDLWDTMVTSTGSRTQPLTIAITTAGFDRTTICWEVHEFALRNCDPNDPLKDPTFYGQIHAVPENAPYDDESLWPLANPNLGVTVSMDFLRSECQRAKANPHYQNTFRRLYLNQWVQQEFRFFDMEKWRGCNGEVNWSELRNRPCYGGLDLSAVFDLTAFVLVFPPIRKREPIKVLCWTFIPEERVRQHIDSDRMPYDQWIKEGWVTPIPGPAIDYTFVMKYIEGLADMFEIRSIAYDPWGARMMMQLMADAGMNVAEMRQGYASMSPPTKELDRLIRKAEIAHGNNPVLSAAMNHVVVTQDPAGNVKPNKAKATERIDPAVALIMALEELTRNLADSDGRVPVRAL